MRMRKKLKLHTCESSVFPFPLAPKSMTLYAFVVELNTTHIHGETKARIKPQMIRLRMFHSREFFLVFLELFFFI